jgi:hypothetical protein
VPFEERDIETSRRWEREWSVVELGGIPVTLVGQDVAYGLRQRELEPLLVKAGYKADCWSEDALRSYAAETAVKRRRSAAQ